MIGPGQERHRFLVGLPVYGSEWYTLWKLTLWLCHQLYYKQWLTRT